MSETGSVAKPSFACPEVKKALGQVVMHIADVASGGALTEREQESFALIVRFFEHLTRIAETQGKGEHPLSEEAEGCLWAYEPALKTAQEQKKLPTPNDHGAHFFSECHLRLSELAAANRPSEVARKVSAIHANGLQMFLNALIPKLVSPELVQQSG
jgi:hypothetical protein